jgi:hypothetical protein
MLVFINRKVRKRKEARTSRAQLEHFHGHCGKIYAQGALDAEERYFWNFVDVVMLFTGSKRNDV